MGTVAIVDLIAAVASALPSIAGDVQAVLALLDGAAAAVRTAQAGDGTVPQAAFDALGIPALQTAFEAAAQPNPPPAA